MNHQIKETLEAFPIYLSSSTITAVWIKKPLAPLVEIKVHLRSITKISYEQLKCYEASVIINQRTIVFYMITNFWSPALREGDRSEPNT